MKQLGEGRIRWELGSGDAVVEWTTYFGEPVVQRAEAFVRATCVLAFLRGQVSR